MANFFLQNLVGILGIIVGGFIAYHVYFLSKKTDLRDALIHRNFLKKQIEELLYRISKGIRRKVELINSKKYKEHYPNNNNLTKDGYTYLSAELKALRFDGVEFFCSSVVEGYQNPDGTFSLKKKTNEEKEVFKLFPVGLIPYEWIEFIEQGGDEFSYIPQFFVHFNGPEKSPYKYIMYFALSDTYHEGSDPLDMKYIKVDVKL